MLAMLEPMALPMAMPGAPSKAAIKETIISGAEVPKATTVRPITSGDTPRLRESPAAPATKRSAPHIKMSRPNKMPALAKSMNYLAS